MCHVPGAPRSKTSRHARSSLRHPPAQASFLTNPAVCLVSCIAPVHRPCRFHVLGYIVRCSELVASGGASNSLTSTTARGPPLKRPRLRNSSVHHFAFILCSTHLHHGTNTTSATAGATTTTAPHCATSRHNKQSLFVTTREMDPNSQFFVWASNFFSFSERRSESGQQVPQRPKEKQTTTSP